MAKELTLADVMQETVDQRIFTDQENVAQPTKRVFRTPSGSYLANFGEPQVRISDGGPNEGRKFVSIQTKLYLPGTTTFRGSFFTKVSWVYAANYRGDPDLQFRLFQKLVRVLGAPNTAEIPEIIAAVKGEWATAWGKEFYNVKISDLLPDHDYLGDDRDADSKVYVFINTGEDSYANAYVNLGYKPDFMVMDFSPVPKV